MSPVICLRLFLPRKKRWFILLSLPSVLVVMVLRIAMDALGSEKIALTTSAIAKEILEVDKCPVCFGLNSSLCDRLSNGDIQVLRNSWSSSEDIKGVYRARWNGTKVVVKRLGGQEEFLKLDVEICSTLGILDRTCDIQTVVKRSFLNPNGSLESFAKRNMDCPSDRLLSSIVSHFTVGKHNIMEDRFIHLTTSLFFNHEPLLLQVFPPESGWPFPKFYGTCGRVIVVEDAGPTLDAYLDKSWGTRVHLALSVLQLARQLTLNTDGWALYLTDPSMENFAVDKDLDVKVVDLEHVIVVDLWSLPVQHSSGTISKERCPPSDPECLAFIPSDLCSGKSRDHNYYAVCRGILADIEGRQGLLHSPPAGQKLARTMQSLLNDCVTGQKSSREEVARDLTKLLSSQLWRSEVF